LFFPKPADNGNLSVNRASDEEWNSERVLLRFNTLMETRGVSTRSWGVCFLAESKVSFPVARSPSEMGHSHFHIGFGNDRTKHEGYAKMLADIAVVDYQLP
jgi:hypothetical protein